MFEALGKVLGNLQLGPHERKVKQYLKDVNQGRLASRCSPLVALELSACHSFQIPSLQISHGYSHRNLELQTISSRLLTAAASKTHLIVNVGAYLHIRQILKAENVYFW